MVESKNNTLERVLEVRSPQLCNGRSELGKIAHLRTLAIRLERFLLAQIDRLELSGEREALMPVDNHLARQPDGFQQECADWESHRQRELERLRHESALLAEAWRRLESEQRSLLAERELFRQGLGCGSQSALSHRGGPSVSHPLESATQGGTASSTNEPDHTDWLQFQQLRREMHRHNRTGT